MNRGRRLLRLGLAVIGGLPAAALAGDLAFGLCRDNVAAATLSATDAGTVVPVRLTGPTPGPSDASPGRPRATASR